MQIGYDIEDFQRLFMLCLMMFSFCFVYYLVGLFGGDL